MGALSSCPDILGYVAAQRVYSPDQQPDVEVLVDGQWWPGTLRAWRRTETGWVALVEWNHGPGLNYLASFPEGRIRRP